MIREHRYLLAIAFLGLASSLGTVRAQGVDFAKTEIQTVKIADNLYVLMGGAAHQDYSGSSGASDRLQRNSAAARHVRDWAGAHPDGDSRGENT